MGTNVETPVRLDSSARYATLRPHSTFSLSSPLFATRSRATLHPPESSLVTVQPKVRRHPSPSESRRHNRSEVQSTNGQQDCKPSVFACRPSRAGFLSSPPERHQIAETLPPAIATTRPEQ